MAAGSGSARGGEAVAPRATCLINNYGYGRYIEEAVDSALNQSEPFDEVIVVDDGSEDDSLERLRARYGDCSRVRVVAKQNEGQLSCFNEGFRVASGDIVFFLDADDVYEPGYLKEALAVYAEHPDCGFLLTGYRRFGLQEDVQLRWPDSRDLGCALVATYSRGWTTGGPTSTMSLRRSVLEKILPLPHLDDWRMEADDCLVLGAALSGARKRYLALPLVNYRVHGENRWFGRAQESEQRLRKGIAKNRLIRLMLDRLGYKEEWLSDLAVREFLTIGTPSRRQLRQYAIIHLGSRLRLSQKWRGLRTMWSHYRDSRPRARSSSR
jgi:glycosyltransferase involved in cell wall biosynthesis